MISILFVRSGTGEQIATVRMSQVPRVGELLILGDWTSQEPGAGDWLEQTACVERVSWELNDRKVCKSAVVELGFGEKKRRR
jgi:hypothetical protein